MQQHDNKVRATPNTDVSCLDNLPRNEVTSQPDKKIHPRCDWLRKGAFGYIRNHLQLTLTVLGVVLGFVIGFALRPMNLSATGLDWVGLPGSLFLRLLKLTIVPVITSSLIVGSSQMKPSENGRVGVCLLLIIVFNAFSAIVLGSVLVVLIKPGSGMNDITTSGQEDLIRLSTSDIISDMIHNIVPDNIIRVTIQTRQTKYIPTLEAIADNSTNTAYQRSVEYVDSINILGLVVVSVIFGLALSHVGDKGAALVAVFESLLEVILLIMKYFMYLSPIGIGSLICASVAAIQDLSVTFRQLGYFVLTVSIGLIAIACVLMPILHAVLIRHNVFKYYRHMSKAYGISFAAAACAPSLPEMYKACQKCDVDNRISALGVPTTLTFTSNGSALFVVVSCLFLAQIDHVHIGFELILLVGVLTLILTLSLPSVPSSSIVVMVIIMTTLGLPTGNFGILFAIEWFLDRFRTSINLITHIVTVVTTDRLCKRHLAVTQQQTAKQHETDEIDEQLSIEMENY